MKRTKITIKKKKRVDECVSGAEEVAYRYSRHQEDNAANFVAVRRSHPKLEKTGGIQNLEESRMSTCSRCGFLCVAFVGGLASSKVLLHVLNLSCLAFITQ